MPRDLTPVQVLSILIQRMERSASAWEAVTLQEYQLAAREVQRYANMLRRAREYLIAQRGNHSWADLTTRTPSKPNAIVSTTCLVLASNRDGVMIADRQTRKPTRSDDTPFQRCAALVRLLQHGRESDQNAKPRRNVDMICEPFHAGISIAAGLNNRVVQNRSRTPGVRALQNESAPDSAADSCWRGSVLPCCKHSRQPRHGHTLARLPLAVQPFCASRAVGVTTRADTSRPPETCGVPPGVCWSALMRMSSRQPAQ